MCYAGNPHVSGDLTEIIYAGGETVDQRGHQGPFEKVTSRPWSSSIQAGRRIHTTILRVADHVAPTLMAAAELSAQPLGAPRSMNWACGCHFVSRRVSEGVEPRGSGGDPGPEPCGNLPEFGER